MTHHIVITGASQGIGAATALAFSRAAAEGRFATTGTSSAADAQTPDKRKHTLRLSLLARNRTNLERVAEACRRLGADTRVVPCDMTRPGEIRAASASILENPPVPTAIVHNAGIFAPGGMDDVDETALQAQLDINLFSAYRLTRELLPAMRAAGRGHLLFMNSVAGNQGYPGGLAYCVSKHALMGLARSLREELMQESIRVTSILPGATFTPTWEGADIDENRLMPAEDIAEAVVSAYAMSPRSVVEEIVVRPQLGDL